MQVERCLSSIARWQLREVTRERGAGRHVRSAPTLGGRRVVGRCKLPRNRSCTYVAVTAHATGTSRPGGATREEVGAYAHPSHASVDSPVNHPAVVDPSYSPIWIDGGFFRICPLTDFTEQKGKKMSRNIMQASLLREELRTRSKLYNSLDTPYVTQHA